MTLLRSWWAVALRQLAVVDSWPFTIENTALSIVKGAAADSVMIDNNVLHVVHGAPASRFVTDSVAAYAVIATGA